MNMLSLAIACLLIIGLSFLYGSSKKQGRKPTTLLLIRHGETDWNARQLCQGQTNIPLNETGIEQAKQLASYLTAQHPDIGAVYSSDLDRAHATALHTATRLGLSVIPKNSLREFHFGLAEGSSAEQIQQLYSSQYNQLLIDYPDRRKRWDLPFYPQAESYNELLCRVQQELTSIAEAHPGEKIAIFTHGRVIKTLIADTLDSEEVPCGIPNCAIACFTWGSETTSSPLTFLEIQSSLD